MVDRNNTKRLGSGFISSVCLETRWLGHLGGFYVPERPCIHKYKYMSIYIYVLTHLHIYMYTYAYIYINVYVHVCIFICIY